MPMEMPIVHPALAELTDEVKGKIRSLQSNEVSIKFGKKCLIRRKDEFEGLGYWTATQYAI